MENVWSEISPDPDWGIAVIAAGGRGRVLAIETPEYFKFNILEVRADRTRTQLFSMEGWSGSGLVADAAGKIFVLATLPNGASSSIFVLSAGGSLLATYPVSGYPIRRRARFGSLLSSPTVAVLQSSEGKLRRWSY